MPITRTLTALTLTAAALALPAGAQASPTVGANAAISAGARAEVHLEQVQQLADTTTKSAQSRARAVLERSRGELRSATAKARALVAKADGGAEVSAAIEAGTGVSATLAADAQGLADIAVKADGRLQDKAAAAIATDLRLQRKLMTATIDLAGRAGDGAAEVLDAAQAVARDTTVAVEAATDVVVSAHVGARAKASADLAVGIGTQTIAGAAQSAHAIEGRVVDSARSGLQTLTQQLGDAATRIRATIAASGIGDDELTLGGHGSVTLDGLAKLGVDATATLSTSGLGGAAASTVHLLTGLLAHR